MCRERIVGYVDLDYVACLDAKKSLSRYVFTCFGGAVSLKACWQKVVALCI